MSIGKIVALKRLKAEAKRKQEEAVLAAQEAAPKKVAPKKAAPKKAPAKKKAAPKSEE